MSPKSQTHQLKIVSLFSGGGGFDLGFSAAGYKIIFSTDIDKHSCETLRLNKNRKDYYSDSIVKQEDIKDLTAQQVFVATGSNKIKVDLVIGGPPCQAFSVFGQRKGLDDPRGNLVWEYLRMVQEIQPLGFVFENVDGLKTIHDGQLFDDMKTALSLDGQYTVSVHSYDMAEYGIPQFRKRVFFIGSRNGIDVPEMTTTHHRANSINGKQPFVTVEPVLKDMPKPGPQSGIPNHIGRNHSQRIIDRYQSLRFGERDPKTRINKLHPLRPSYTIIVGSDKGGGKGHVHPFDPREVTPRESARLQTFPDWWEFYGSGRHVIRQVGNAVPPLFAALLAEHLKVHLFGIKSNLSYKDLVQVLELDFIKAYDNQGLLQP